MASCYYIYCTTLGLSWGFGNQGLGAFHPVPWYSFWYKLICTRDWVESTQSEIPESALQSERGEFVEQI